ncbi:MAG TPA: S41 family peptidase, partial [Bacteroidales bacterium]|nr:S41 family peptidase [Bacteroidales bacterium]
MNNNINKSAVQPIYFAILISIGFLLGTYNNSLKTNNQYYKILEVINAVNQEYVDTVKTDKLVELAINGLLQGLDPHSYYINSEDFTESNDLLQGSFDGIGIQFRLEKDTIIVINTINGGPSEKVGLKAGDRIVKINGETVAGVKIKENEVIHKLKGPRGTKVQISVFRKNVKSLIDFTITRDAIPVYSIDVAYMILNDIGYIRISRFSATTKDELIKELLSLKNKGMKKLILDLRGNGGGYMDAAIDISNEFLFKGNTIVFTKGRNRKPEYFFANGKGHFQQGSLIVLIDELSASASEIVSGAIQDWDRG